MKKNTFVLMALVSLMLTSCGSGNKVTEVKLSPAPDKTCYGDLKPYLELYDCEYTLKKLDEYKSMGGDKLSDMELTVALSSLCSVDLSWLSISFTLLDENEMPINGKCTITGDGWQDGFSNAVKSGLKNGKEKIVFSVVSKYSGNSPVNREEWAEIVEKAKYVSISASSASFANGSSSSSIDQGYEYEDEEEEEDEDDEVIVSTSSTNWDEVLDDFEEYVDKYISLVKKASSGDLSAMTEYVRFLEKAEDLADQLDDAEDEMTSAQLKRYMKIAQKMTDAAIDML